MNWVVMPCYNCVHLTRDALASVLAQDIGNLRVVATNDGSDDNTRQFLGTFGKQVHVVSYPTSRYITYGWNKALSYLFDELKQPYALVINNDIRLRPDAYRLLVEDGGQFVTCVGSSSGAIFPGSLPSGEKRPHPDFSAFLIRREVWDKIGSFDETMKHYCSDGDYHLRMHKAGIAAYCLDLPFYHVASGTLKNVSPEARERVQRQAQADRDTFYARYGCEMGSPAYYGMFQ